MTARADYRKLQKKYGMPKLEALEETFGFSLDDESKTPLPDIKRAISDMLDTVSDLAESILFVSEGSAPSSIVEAHLLHGKRDTFFELYRKSHELRWRSLRAYLLPTEKEIALFIKDCYEIWNRRFRPEIDELTRIMEIGWKEFKGKEDEIQRYLG